MNPSLLAAVALGGAAGALARYGFAGAVARFVAGGFPYATLGANALGSLAMGVLVETSGLFWSPGPALRAFLAVGFLGGFTTFSTFSLDAVMLMERGAFGAALVYVAVSVVLSVTGLLAGLWLVRMVAV